MKQDNKIILFQETQVRRVLQNGVWFFSIIDVIKVLTGNTRPSKYWTDLKKKLIAEGYIEVSEKIGKLKMPAADGKNYPTDAADTKTILRIVQSIPSPNAEPFKRWLSEVGYEHIEEIENPELAVDRARELYKLKGYSSEWIEMRLKSIETRQQLTDEWQTRGVRENVEYAILTAEISKATFGLTPSDYKNFKGLKRENLRDHMTPLELIFTMLGEEVTRSIAVADDAQGFLENHDAAQQGGKLAGEARERVENDRRVKVVSPINFLQQIADATQQNPPLLPENPPTDEAK